MQNPFEVILGQLSIIADDVQVIKHRPATEPPPSITADPAKYANSRQLSKRYGVHHNTIYNWHKQGYFPKHVIDGVTLYAIADIDAFIESRATTADA